MKPSHSLALALLGAVAAAAAADAARGAATPYPFDRYQVILQRSPFGEAAPAEAPPAPPAEPSLAAKTLRLATLVEIEGGGVRAGILDTQTNISLYLSQGQKEGGIELVSVDLDKEEATIRRGGETIVLKMQSNEEKPAVVARPSVAAPSSASSSRILSYAERRRMRAQDRRPPQIPAPTAHPTPTPKPPTQPRLSGVELEKHLRDYQMEVIRQGLPPLPIPLTPDQDKQLVKEGVLPPMETVAVPANGTP